MFDRLVAARSEAQTTLDELSPLARAMGPDLENALAARHDAEEALETAREARRVADDEVSRWTARADALEQALDAARSAAGADALASTTGVLGSLLELIDIDPGWEAAIEAAAGEALRAVVVDSAANGRSALESLAAQDLSGAVLALGGSPSLAVEPGSIRARVRPLRDDVGPLLDALFGSVRAVDGGWPEALDSALADPQAVIVSSAGDRFGPTGWRIGQAGSGATGAALDEASARAADAALDAERAAERVATAQQALAQAVRAVDELERRSREVDQGIAESTAVIERSTQQLHDIAIDRDRLDRQQGEIQSRVEADRVELEDLQLRLPGLEEVEAAHVDRTKSMAEARVSLEERMAAVGARRTELEVKAASLDSRREVLIARQAEVEARLRRLVEERAAARTRREHLQHSLDAVAELDDAIDGHRRELERWITRLHQEHEAQSEASRRVSATLSARRNERQAAERELVEVRERRSRVEVAEAEHRIRLETLTDALRSELDTEPEAAMAAERPDVPEGASPESRVRELERELKLMGPINPLALEEFEELKVRHEFLDGQLNDVKSTKRDLQRLINEIDDEIVSVFSNAYADVATNFVELFQVLFPGGRGAVVLTDPNDLLNTGVEIEAKPSGKNVKKLSLLSGGERSLVALGFLFAVFKSRPSPFYVMDEVEAALDDMNLKRLLSLIDEFRKEAQLVIVSHQKKTMEAADVLYGVSMQSGGSSKVVSERVSTH